MPANFSASLKKLVLLKEDELCSLKRHFSGCIRQVVGYLDLLAKNDADRVVWVKAKNIQKHCKNYGKKNEQGKPTQYSMAMIEKALKCLRETGVLSHNVEIPIQERRGFIVQGGYVVTPHDALCCREGRACRYVGMGFVPGTRWAAAPGNGVWFAGKNGAGAVPATVVFTVGSMAAITEPSMVGGMDAIMVANDKNSAGGDGSGDGLNSVQAPEVADDSNDGENVLAKFCDDAAAPNLSSLVSQSTLEAVPTIESANLQQNSNRDSISSLGLLTDQKQRRGHPLRERLTASTADDNEPSATEVKNDATESAATADKLSACAPLSSAPDLPARPSVGQYFAGARDNILDLLCDGEFNAAIEKVWKRWDDLDDACREVVRAYASMILVDRKTLSYLVGKVMDVLVENHTGPNHYAQPSKRPWPPGLLKAKEVLERGGALLRDQPPPAIVLEEMTEKKLAAWNEFSASEEGQQYADPEVRREVFDKLWSKPVT